MDERARLRMALAILEDQLGLAQPISVGDKYYQKLRRVVRRLRNESIRYVAERGSPDG